MRFLRQKSQFISPAIENFVMKKREPDTVPLNRRIKYTRTWIVCNSLGCFKGSLAIVSLSPGSLLSHWLLKYSQIFSYKSISHIFCQSVGGFFIIFRLSFPVKHEAHDAFQWRKSKRMTAIAAVAHQMISSQYLDRDWQERLKICFSFESQHFSVTSVSSPCIMHKRSSFSLVDMHILRLYDYMYIWMCCLHNTRKYFIYEVTV
jgi:hypothetical protein